jgi:acetyl esterase/lipase
MDRRTMIGAGLAAAAWSKQLLADTLMPGDGSVPSDPKDIIALWPGTPPGGAGIQLVNRIQNRNPGAAPIDRYIDQVGTPVMSVFRPDRPDGSAMIVAPGGGYVREMLDFEGTDVSSRFNAAGVTCFVLRYRLPGEGWADRSDVPLQDAQRAMRLVRAGVGKYGIDPGRVGFMGFSAGGHVACSIATRFAAKVYAPVDAADGMDARPSFSVPIYPVVTMGEGCHKGSRDNLLGPDPSPAKIIAYSCEKNVPADAPPSWICLAADDMTVPPLPNGVAYFAALRAASIPVEIHVFEAGGHGFGLSKTVGRPDAAWPDLLLHWGASHGFFKRAG